MSEKEYTPDDIPKTSEGEDNTVDAARGNGFNLYRDYRTINTYQFLMECEAGSGGFSGITTNTSENLTWSHNTDNEVKSYIPYNLTENFYPNRIRDSVYINDFSKYLKAKYKEVFAQKEISTYVEDSAGQVDPDHPYAVWTQNVTGGGMGKEEFTKSFLKACWRDAVSFAIVDNDIETGGEPYVYRKNAVEVAYDKKDGYLYGTDKKGSLTWIIFDEPTRMNGNQKEYVRRYWGIDEFYELVSDSETAELSEWKIVQDTRMVNNLSYKGNPFLPVKAIFSQARDKNTDYLPKPDSYAIAEVCLAVYSKGSKLDYVIDKQSHSRLVINGRMNGVANGVDNAMIISEGDNKLFQPFLLSPDPRHPESHQKRIDKLNEYKLELMDEGGVSASAKSLTQESGVSKVFTFSAKATTSKESLRIALELSVFFETAWKVYNNQESAGWKSVTTYPTEFIPQTEVSIMDLMDVAEFYSSRNLKQNESEVIKAITRKLFPNAEKDKIEELVEEADNISPTE